MKNKSTRRHYMAKIQKLVIREIEDINTRYNTDQLNTKKDEITIKKLIRHAYRNEGRSVRTKAAAGREFFCKCEWCVSNWTYSSQKEISRINDEEQDFLKMGSPPCWGEKWSDYREETDEEREARYNEESYEDFLWEDWRIYLDDQDINPKDCRRQRAESHLLKKKHLPVCSFGEILGVQYANKKGIFKKID